MKPIALLGHNSEQLMKIARKLKEEIEQWGIDVSIIQFSDMEAWQRGSMALGFFDYINAFKIHLLLGDLNSSEVLEIHIGSKYDLLVQTLLGEPVKTQAIQDSVKQLNDTYYILMKDPLDGNSYADNFYSIIYFVNERSREDRTKEIVEAFDKKLDKKLVVLPSAQYLQTAAHILRQITITSKAKCIRCEKPRDLVNGVCEDCRKLKID